MIMIKLTDALTHERIAVREDLIFKIEEAYSSSNMSIRQITFVGGEVEYVEEGMEEILRLIWDKNS